jgi:hypothetical protein
VEADPTRKGWSRYYVKANYWPGPGYPGTLGNTYDHPDGILELELQQRLPGETDETPGWILLDPWTGEVIDVRLPDWVVEAAASGSPSPVP